MSRIKWILFSKHRSFQVYSCLKSLFANSDIPQEDVTVLYMEKEGCSFDPVRKKFKCNFVVQKNFYHDILHLLYASDHPYSCFMVDDLIFRDTFSQEFIANFLDTHADINSFSLRLGKNIQSPGKPLFTENIDNVITWQTRPGLGTVWNFYWEVSSTVYRKEEVLHYLDLCPEEKLTFPNPLEQLYYSRIPNFHLSRKLKLRVARLPRHIYWRLFRYKSAQKKCAAFEKSIAFTQGVNMVADRGIEYNTYLGPEDLHTLIEEGWFIDYENLKDVNVFHPNMGPQFFRITNDAGESHPLSKYQL